MMELARFQLEFLELDKGDYSALLVEITGTSKHVIAEETITKMTTMPQLSAADRKYDDVVFQSKVNSRALFGLEDIEASALAAMPLFRNNPPMKAMLDMGYNWLLRCMVSKYEQASLSIDNGQFVITGSGHAINPDANRLRKDGTRVGAPRPKSGKRLTHDWF
jgi:hypothetical protein